MCRARTHILQYSLLQKTVCLQFKGKVSSEAGLVSWQVRNVHHRLKPPVAEAGLEPLPVR